MIPIRRGTALRLGLRRPQPQRLGPWLQVRTIAEVRAWLGVPEPVRRVTVPRSMLGPTSCQTCNEYYPEPCVWHR